MVKTPAYLVLVKDIGKLNVDDLSPDIDGLVRHWIQIPKAYP